MFQHKSAEYLQSDKQLFFLTHHHSPILMFLSYHYLLLDEILTNFKGVQIKNKISL